MSAQTSTGEEWRPVPGMRGVEASSLGRVRVVVQPTRWGRYFGVRIGRRWTRLHELIAAAFHGPRPPGLVIDHEDQDEANNLPGNLRYVTQAVNMEAGGATHRRGARNPAAKLTAATVRAIRRRRARGEPGSLLAAEYGLSEGAVCDIHKRRTWAHLS